MLQPDLAVDVKAPVPPPGKNPGACPEVSGVTDWLIGQGLLRSPITSIIEGFCERLVALGIPLWRGYLVTQTLHPTVAGLGFSWRPETGIHAEEYPFRTEPSKDYLTSPIKHMVENELTVFRLPLDRPVPFPLLERFRSQGATDYVALMVGFGINGVKDCRTGVVATWTTDHPEGFDEFHVKILKHLLPRLSLALQARLGHDIANNLLDTYVGPEAGRRILGGEIRRGSLEVIRAVIFYTDMRGFTTQADQSDRATLVEMLNAYFDCLVPVIEKHRGQVLKFLGDGLLATFPLEAEDAARVCARSLDAAAEMLDCLRDLNHDRILQERPVMDLDMVLHLGDVFYGNVGSANRLDFTVIGPAVNEASRIETLCGQYDRNLLISETFARAAVRSSNRLVSIGRFALRGVRAAQTIYTLDGLDGGMPQPA